MAPPDNGTTGSEPGRAITIAVFSHVPLQSLENVPEWAGAVLCKPEAHLRGPFKLVYTTVVIFYNLWERKEGDENPDSRV